MSTINEMLVQAIRHAAIHNPDVQVAPSCILWPDGDRQWEPVAARLQAELPEMFVLGDYDVEKRTGPAIWLRCVIANKAPKVELPNGSTPILYLPGVSRQDLRAVESCPDHLKPLAELQYSGVIWSQINAKDWTILAFLKSDQVVPYVSGQGEYRAARSQTAPEYVAVRAFNPTDQGPVSELFLDWDTVAPVKD